MTILQNSSIYSILRLFEYGAHSLTEERKLSRSKQLESLFMGWQLKYEFIWFPSFSSQLTISVSPSFRICSLNFSRLSLSRRPRKPVNRTWNRKKNVMSFLYTGSLCRKACSVITHKHQRVSLNVFSILTVRHL